MAARFTWAVDAGSIASFQVTYETSAGVAIPLSSYTPKCQVKRMPAGVVVATADVSGSTLGSGIVLATLPSEDTTAMYNKHRGGAFAADVLMLHASDPSLDFRLAEMDIVLSPAVTER